MVTVAQFKVSFSRFLDATGAVVAELPPFAQDSELLKDLYRWMLLTREFDTRAVTLQRTGQLGTFPSSLGQEAVSVGLAHAMQPTDVFVPSFREQGAQFVRGVSPTELLLYWGGDERGSDFAGPREDFPVSVPVGSQAAHAVGIALAIKLRRENRAVVCALGDGATSKGDIYEAMNVAGAWQLPLVFIINNNAWAISVPRSAQTAAETLAQKAIAAGFPGEQVDGNDIIAVRHATDCALQQCREGGGPQLIEAITYRLGDHTTADDAARYRQEEEVSSHWQAEPLARLRTHLSSAHGWDRDQEEAVIADCREQIEQAVADYLATPVQDTSAMFDYLYAELPAPLAEQYQALQQRSAQEQDHD
ncbi:MAG: pyruvate dehydrogenase (acetyl-transferring) E1 component subunit alpha [Halieaceae bacterium]